MILSLKKTMKYVIMTFFQSLKYIGFFMDSVNNENSQITTYSNQSLTATPNPLSPDTVQLLQQVAQINHRMDVEQEQRMRQLRPYFIIATLAISILILTVLFVKSRSAAGVLSFNRPPIL
jgi:hypothetical protein